MFRAGVACAVLGFFYAARVRYRLLPGVW